MIWLMVILHVFIGSTLAGSFVIAALAMGHDTLTRILVTAAAGFAVAFAVSWIVAKQLYQSR